MSDKFAGRFKVNYRLLLVAILLLATILRIYGLNNLSPPGLAHDEVAHWLINQDILAGNHAVYFTEAYGHEAGFHYVQTLFMVLLGDNTLALRLPSAFAGVLLVAVSFTLARRLFGLETALLSSSLLAVLFWPVFYSRLALRAISLPLLSGLSAVFWWSGWQSGSASSRPGFAWLQSPIAYFAVAGLLSGLSLYTYMAARVVPIFWALFILYLLLFQRPGLKSCWRGVLLFFLSQLVVATPLILFLLTTPGAEYRISEVDAPLRALLGGNLEPVLDNSLKIVGMFGFRGDPLWRQNIAFLPVFAPVVSVFFYIGTLICLWLWRKPRYIFLILWLFTATIPSILTIDAPSSIRIVNALPIIGLLPAIGLQVIHIFKPFSTVSGKLSPEIGRIGIYLALMTLLLTCTVRTARGLFVTWPAEDKVQFVWQKALTEAAGYLDRQKTAGPVAIGGWTPGTMDPPTMALTLWRDDLSLRYFDPGQTLILPVSPAGQSIRVIRPAILPLEPYLEALLVAWGAGPEAIDTFTLYQLPALPAIRPKYPQDVSFGKELTFLGYDQLTGCEPGNGACELITYWQVEMLDGGSRSIFLHLVDPAGTIIDQDDGLGAPAGHWQPGDIILQRHTLTIPAGNEVLSLRAGVYNPEDSRRLLAADGGDFVELPLFGVGAGG